MITANPARMPAAMKPGRFRTLLADQWRGGTSGAVLAVLFGCLLFAFPLGDGWVRLSYDLPFALRGNLRADDVVLIYLDDLSHEELGQSKNAPWDRALHAQLVDILRTNETKAVVFDILFSEPSADAGADAALQQAIARHGRVILAADYILHTRVGAQSDETVELPYAPFRDAAAGWGNAKHLVDSDFGVRQRFPNLQLGEAVPSLAWAAATALDLPAVRAWNTKDSELWINYFGPPGHLASVNYALNFLPDGIPPGFYRDKIVFVGAKMSAGFSGAGKDEFATPYTRWDKGFSPGAEIHATAFLNLLHANGLTRFPPRAELLLILLTGLGFGMGLVLVRRPWLITLAGLAGVLLVFGLAWWLFASWHAWFAWTILAGQIGAASAWAIFHSSIRAHIDKQVLERSLAFHLSPRRVKQLLRQPELLKPGAEKKEISLLFSDIASFSTICERALPDRLFAQLNKYYSQTIVCVHQNEGTVLQLIGDAIFAIWNAPEPQPNHQELACRAALLLRDKVVAFDLGSEDFPMRTRVGLHSGEASVGNLGAADRFEYSAIGANTNLASRLEGLNKHLGTEILASAQLISPVQDIFITRPLGDFRLKGFDRVVGVYELIGLATQPGADGEWIKLFVEGLKRFKRQEFGPAAEAFQQVLEHRPQDGPAKFYLGQIEQFRKAPPLQNWFGEINMQDK